MKVFRATVDGINGDPNHLILSAKDDDSAIAFLRREGHYVDSSWDVREVGDLSTEHKKEKIIVRF